MKTANKIATLCLLYGVILRLFGFIDAKWLIASCVPALALFLTGFFSGLFDAKGK